MKKTDAVIGTEYAYRSSSYQRKAERVTLLGFVQIPGRYSSSPTKTGWRVRFEDAVVPVEKNVTGREIDCTWEEYREDRRKQAEASKLAREQRAASRASRTDAAHALERLYQALGLEPKWVWVSNRAGDNEKTLLEQFTLAGFEAQMGDGTPERRNDDWLYVKVSHDSVRDYFVSGHNIAIPASKVPALVEAAEVFL